MKLARAITSGIAGIVLVVAAFRFSFLNWIAAAKRPETRQKRVKQAVEWIAQGKQRNWKYMNC